MTKPDDRRYAIGEVSAMTEVPTHLLRQWEAKFAQLRPRRTRSNRRYYTARDIEIVRRIKSLLRHEGMTIDGARIRLSQELSGEGRPRTNREAIDLADRLEAEVRALLELLDDDGQDLRNPE